MSRNWRRLMQQKKKKEIFEKRNAWNSCWINFLFPFVYNFWNYRTKFTHHTCYAFALRLYRVHSTFVTPIRGKWKSGVRESNFHTQLYVEIMDSNLVRYIRRKPRKVRETTCIYALREMYILFLSTFLPIHTALGRVFRNFFRTF